MILIGQIQKILDSCINYATKSISIWCNTDKSGGGTSYQPIVNSAGQLVVQTSSISGTSDVNLKQVGGVTYQLGSSTTASAMSVVLATDSRLLGVTASKVIDGQSIGSSATYTSSATTVVSAQVFATQFDISTAGSKNITIGYTCSLDGTTYYTPSGGGSVGTFTADGYASFAPELCKYLKMTVLNNDASSATVNLWLGYQTM